MNLLESGFLVLNLFMLVFGFLINYVNYIIPKCITQLFRYGRANISSAKPVYLRSIEVPKRWFWHFYVYAVALQLVTWVTLIRIYNSGLITNHNNLWISQVLDYVGERKSTVSSTSTLLAATLFLLHLSRRLYETLWVSVYSNTKMNILHYLVAFAHYTGAILCLVAHSPLLASSAPVGSQDSIMPKVGHIGVREILGVILFLFGNYVQNQAHVGLANLRKGGKAKTEDSTRAHKIPRGGFFEQISCPNYFGEIVIYIALAWIFRFQNPSWNQCMYWVVSNQITSGIMNHHWYKDTFKDYPKQRKAVIPYVI